MFDDGLNSDYQVAWLDLLNPVQQGILSLANHCEPFPYKEKTPYMIPKLPFCLVKSWNMKWFNKWFFQTKKKKERLPLEEFNNPLDKIIHWNRLYGPKGLIQFQAIFDQDQAVSIIERLIVLINLHKATPTLSVLKLFNKSGEGLLSFCKPGFSLAIDFINNEAAKFAISAMNQLISGIGGRIYLAKDLLLTSDQYEHMYQEHRKFSQLINNSMSSDLSKRLGITQ
jgi:hypothetical protein